MKIIDKICESIFRRLVPFPERGLPYQLFRFCSYIVPMINIELLIADENNKVALTWREHSKDVPIPGWHLPGGIIRINETIDLRIRKTASEELGIDNIENWKILGITETRIPLKSPRRHFISIIIYSRVKSSQISKKARINFKENIPGKLISNHQRYKSIIDKILSGQSVDEFIFYPEDLNFIQLFNGKH